jgi:hypothetical protein
VDAWKETCRQQPGGAGSAGCGAGAQPGYGCPPQAGETTLSRGGLHECALKREREDGLWISTIKTFRPAKTFWARTSGCSQSSPAAGSVCGEQNVLAIV